jgi:hypothetical protein
MIDSSGRLFLDLVPINRRSCGSLKVLVIINTISKQDVNVIDSKDVFVNLVIINTISKDVNYVTITVIIIKKKSVSTAINASPSTSILPGRSPAINASPSTSILPGRSPTISTPSKKLAALPHDSGSSYFWQTTPTDKSTPTTSSTPSAVTSTCPPSIKTSSSPAMQSSICLSWRLRGGGMEEGRGLAYAIKINKNK